MIRVMIRILLPCCLLVGSLSARPITAAGKPAVLDVRAAASGSLRITLRPAGFAPDFPVTPVLPERDYPAPALSLRELDAPVTAEVAGLAVEVRPEPLSVVVRGNDGALIQALTWEDDGAVSFPLDDQPVLGMGEGGPATPAGRDWRREMVEFDRRGRLDPGPASRGQTPSESRVDELET